MKVDNDNDIVNGKQIMVDKEFVTGLVTTVMNKMMHAMSEWKQFQYPH